MSKPEFYVTDVSLLATLADKEAELVALRDQARRIHGGEPRWCESCNDKGKRRGCFASA